MYEPLVNELNRFAAGLSSPRDLETWLVSELQTILDSEDREAIDIANEVDGALIELGEGLMPEIDLLARVQGLVRVAGTSQMVELVDAEPAIVEERIGTAAETLGGVLTDIPITNLQLAGWFA